VSSVAVLGVGLLAIFAALTIAVVALAVLREPTDGVARSLAAVQGMRTGPRALRDQELERPFTDRVLDPLVARCVELGRRFTPDERVQRIRRRLDLAGNPPGWDSDRVLGLKALALLTSAVVALVVPPVLGAGLGLSSLAVLAGATAGWVAPSLWLYQKAYDRSERIRRALPDAMDLLTISVESGLAFDAALAQVARNTEGPLAQEFFRVLQEMQIGTGRVNAMRALSERTDVPELRSFVGAMIQADAFGIPVASVLRVQAREMRVKRSQRAEEAAQKVPIKILFPLIFCILPCLFIVVLGPGVVLIMNSFNSHP
jgi:tight adherence protein C